MFPEVQNAIDEYEAAVSAKALDSNGLDGLAAAKDVTKQKLDAATQADADAQAAIDAQSGKIAADTAAIKDGLLAIAASASAAAATL